MYRNTTIYFYRFRLFYYLIYIIIPLYDIIDSIKNIWSYLYLYTCDVYLAIKNSYS